MIASTPRTEFLVILCCTAAMRCASPQSTTEVVARSKLDRWVGTSIEAVQLTQEQSVDPASTLSMRLGSTESPSLVLLRFAPIWQRGREINSAFLLLDPVDGPPQVADEVPLEVWRITEEWVASEVTWNDLPTLSYPLSETLGRPDRSVLTIDVTQHIRHFAKHPRFAFGLAIRCAASPRGGVSYAMGLAGGSPPRLEVYGTGLPR